MLEDEPTQEGNTASNKSTSGGAPDSGGDTSTQASKRSRRTRKAAPADAELATAAEASKPRRTRKKAAAKADEAEARPRSSGSSAGADAPATEAPARRAAPAVTFQEPTPLFQEPVEAAKAASRKRRPATSRADEPTDTSGRAAVAPDEAVEPAKRRPTRKRAAAPAEIPAPAAAGEPIPAQAAAGADDTEEAGEAARKRRRRSGRGRRREASDSSERAVEAPAAEAPADDTSTPDTDEPEPDRVEADSEAAGSGTRRRRRRRRRAGAGDEAKVHAADDPERTVVKIREPRQQDADEADVTMVKGSTRLEAKKQRRREGREAGRRRAPVITEAEFLARRESVDRVMVVRQAGEITQIAVLEDGVLVEHYVNRESHTSLIGNVYLGKVQNVLPSMEAAFVDIGRGRNAVLYAGEVNFDVAGLDGQPKRIENVLKSGQSILVQVTKDPVAQKGARLTSQISLPGRYLVYVPEGSMTGISRKLPDTERNRLKILLRSILPEDAGVIVRTAAEGATEDELKRDVNRLSAQWDDIQKKAKSVGAPALLYGEPDLPIRVVRDIFNEDFTKLVVEGDDAWDMIDAYVAHVAPDLGPRLELWTGTEDVFTADRIDEQIVKALDRKVWLPSGGSLVIDRTEAMTVIDVNTGKFTGQGGNLEETVTKNNLEAAEEIVRQLRLRDVGGIIVIDFIDMVLESNRELVLRRLLECLGRDRTKHQVAEITSLGLVQMTRKRVGQGLLEAFSEPCECCNGRGVKIHMDVLEAKPESRRRAGAGAAAPAAVAAVASVQPPVTVSAESTPGDPPAPVGPEAIAAALDGNPREAPASRSAEPPADLRPSGLGAVPEEEAHPSYPGARTLGLGWPG